MAVGQRGGTRAQRLGERTDQFAGLIGKALERDSADILFWGGRSSKGSHRGLIEPDAERDGR